jgi:phosphatidylinositol alpha-1,6-mannosyltransferase
MKILIPTVDYPPIEGGIGTVALAVSRELAALGHEVTVVAPRLHPSNPQFGDMREHDAAEPVRVVRFDGYDLGWFRFFPFFRKAWPETKDTGLILAINIAYGGILARLAKLRRGVPYIAFAYAYEFLKFQQTPLVPTLFRGIYRHAVTTVAISSFTAHNLESFGVPARRITTILPGAPEPRPVSGNSVQAVRERLYLGTGPLILSVGRFIPRKGQIVLVRAMPKVLEQCPAAHLVMVGRGPCLADCVEQARAFGIEGQVHCPGYVDDDTLAALYQACDLFALPTGEDERGQVEGFGLVFAEAHAYGKPVVAGRSGGVEDAVHDGETGLLVPPGDPDAVAKAIVSLLNDPDRARNLGEKGRERVRDELNWHEFTRRMLESLET